MSSIANSLGVWCVKGRRERLFFVGDRKMKMQKKFGRGVATFQGEREERAVVVSLSLSSGLELLEPNEATDERCRPSLRSRWDGK